MLSLVLLSATGCLRESQTHLVPSGHVGPVVIVFGDSTGREPRKEEFSVVYEIPADGVLRVRTDAPDGGLALVHYYFVGPDGQRQVIPYKTTDSTQVQVFAKAVGKDARRTNGKTWVSYVAYVVGVPADRDDWAVVRDAAKDRVTGRLASPQLYCDQGAGVRDKGSFEAAGRWR
jgi:hypothetical protein